LGESPLTGMHDVNRLLVRQEQAAFKLAVLESGKSVSLSTNVDLVDDTTIDVAVPRGFAPGTYLVQVNTQFNGEDRFSNTLSLTLTN
jgi:hypothetical protein